MTKPRDQDGGWAWVVLGACSACLLVTSGLSILAGMFQSVFLQELGSGVVITSWVTSLFSSLMQLAGPVSGLVCSVFGCRVSVMAGGILLTSGLLMSSFCRDVIALLFTFGISSGLGLGLVFSAAIVKVNLSFLRLRPLATGSVMAAGGAGIMVMPALCRFLLSSFSCWQTLAILAAVAAQLVVAGALLFPDKQGAAGSPQAGVLGTCRRRCQCWLCLPSSSEPEKQTSASKSDIPCKTALLDSTQDTTSTTQGTNQTPASASRLPSVEDPEVSTVHCRTSQHSHTSHPSSVTETPAWTYSEGDVAESETHPLKVLGSEQYLQNSAAHTLVMYDKNSSIQEAEAAVLMIPKQESSELLGRTSDSDVPVRTFWGNMVSVLTSPSIVLICLQMLLSSAAVGIMLVHYVTFCIQMGSHFDDVSLGFSANGVALTVSRFLIGALAQNRDLDPLSLYVGMALVTSVILALSPVVAVTPTLQICVLIGLGLYCGSSYVLLTEITIHCAGVDTLGLAFGLEMVAAGVGLLVAPPLAGWLVVVTKSYSHAMFLSGFLYLISAFVAMLLSLTRPKWTPGDASDFEKDVTCPDD